MTIEEAIRILTIATDNADLSVAVNNSENYFGKLNEACQLAADELHKRQWISVEDRLPEKGERVLITNGAFVCESFLANNDKWQRGGTDLFFMQPTHWQPMPEPPKERE